MFLVAVVAVRGREGGGSSAMAAGFGLQKTVLPVEREEEGKGGRTRAEPVLMLFEVEYIWAEQWAWSVDCRGKVGGGAKGEEVIELKTAQLPAVR